MRQLANIRRNVKRGLHIRTAQSGLTFLYLNEQKICRYYPDRQVLEFKEHSKNGRLTEVILSEFVAGLERL